MTYMRRLFTHRHYHRAVPLLGFVALFVVAGFFACAPETLAQSATNSLAFQTVATESRLPTRSLPVIIVRLVRYLLGFLGLLAVLVLMYAGWLRISSQGNPATIEKSNTVMKNGAIGLAIILFSYAIASFVLGVLLNATTDGGARSTADQYYEPLSGSLGAGIIEDHYPFRSATDVVRNTKIFVTFTEPIDPTTVIDGYTDETTTDLITTSVLIYPTEEGAEAQLGSTEVVASVNEAGTIFVFDPVPLLGSDAEDVEYTVELTPAILRANGSPAFTGSFAEGYSWNFTTSTEVDLTPPQVVFVLPQEDTVNARNSTIEVTFSEAMDPIASTGTYDGSTNLFDNIRVFDADNNRINGTFVISNGYRTVDFTTDDACGVDPCGDTVYCLPGNQSTIRVEALSAPVDPLEPPQTSSSAVPPPGLVDAAANVLDGDGDGLGEGIVGDGYPVPDLAADPPVSDTADHYVWEFATNNLYDDRVPAIHGIAPELGATYASTTDPVEISFSMPMKASTLDTTTISLWPDPQDYEMWFALRKTENPTTGNTTALISHPPLVSDADGGHDYYPVISNRVRGTNQFCMHPSLGVSVSDSADYTCGGGSLTNPYCMDGVKAASEQTTESGALLQRCGVRTTPLPFCCDVDGDSIGDEPSAVACPTP